MGFGVDYSKADSGSGIVPEGEYEVIIRSAGEDYTKGGTRHLNIPLAIRNDVEQPRKNAFVWHKIWQKKEPAEADIQCEGFVAWQIHAISKAAGLPNGKKYESLEDWCKDLTGKLLRVSVQHEDYNGRRNVRVQEVGPSKHPDCKHVFKSNEAATDTAFQELDDEEEGDLPF